MRIFKQKISWCLSIPFFFLLGCSGSSYGSLCVSNNTDVVLHIETNIESPCFATNVTFGKENKQCVAETNVQDGHKEVYEITDFVKNDDAYVRVYLDGDSVERTLLKEWRYADRDSSGKQLFNLECSEYHHTHIPDGNGVVTYIFIIENEDIQ